MGRKSRIKRNNRMWLEGLAADAQATPKQRAEALTIYRDLCAQHPVRRSAAFARSLTKVYEEKGEVMGCLVMCEFARSEGYLQDEKSI